MAGFHSVDFEVSGLSRSLRCVAVVTYTDVSGELSTFYFKNSGVRVGCVARVSRGSCCPHLQGRNVVSHIDSCPSRFMKRRVYCLVRDVRIGTCEPLSYLPRFDPESGSIVFLSTHLERIPLQAMQKPTRVPTSHCASSKSAHVDRRHGPELPCINTPIPNFTEIHHSGSSLIHAVGHKALTKLIGAFPDFASASIKGKVVCVHAVK